MKSQTYTLELLTPCFCAGADQAKAEIRAPSIRGQLRWWFRTLGGSVDDERSVFGGMAGTAHASSLILRVKNVQALGAWTPPKVDPNSPDSYVWYFASVSGKAPGSGSHSLGPRWNVAGALPPKSTFTLEILQSRPLAKPLQDQLDQALRCFLQLGAIGLRATRGLGTFVCHQEPFQPATLDLLKTKGFHAEFRPAPLADTAAIAREIGSLVKGTRKQNNMKAERPSPFGSSDPRQTSAIYFRPVRTNLTAKECALVVFEAPHSRVLGPASDRPRVIGNTPSKLQKPIPMASRY